MNELIPIEEVNALEVFQSEKTIMHLVDAIRESATDFDPDVSTPAGRKEIAAQAYKVSKSKTVIDKAGKSLTDEWFKKKKIVDAGRRAARDALDELRDEIRRPLTEWEAEEERKAQELARQAEMLADEEEAYARNDLIDREAAVKAAEEKLEAERLERERKEAEAREEEARKEQEEQIRKEAEEQARKDAEDEIQRQKELAEEAERQCIAAEEREKEAEKQAELDKEKAIEEEQRKAREEAERKERERIEREEEVQREAQARAADRENRRKVNRAIVGALVEGGVSTTAAQKAVTLIASGKVPAVSIRY